MEYIFLPPDQCTAQQIDDFQRLAIKGRQVQAAGLGKRILSAFLLGFVYEDSILISIGALKNPSPNHRSEVFSSAGVADLMTKYPGEAGWAFTEPDFRGKGIHSNVLSQLLAHSPTNVYATTKAVNVPKILTSLGFTEAGRPYNNRTGELLRLFTFDR